MSDPLTPEQQIIEVLKDVSRDDAYQLLAGLMHTLLDLMADRQVDMLLIFFVTMRGSRVRHAPRGGLQTSPLDTS